MKLEKAENELSEAENDLREAENKLDKAKKELKELEEAKAGGAGECEVGVALHLGLSFLVFSSPLLLSRSLSHTHTRTHYLRTYTSFKTVHMQCKLSLTEAHLIPILPSPCPQIPSLASHSTIQLWSLDLMWSTAFLKSLQSLTLA